MKSLILLVAVLAVVHGNSLICRNYRAGALLPNPENCAEFFMCRPGRAVRFTCPDNTKYNAAIQACDPTMAVRCKPGKLPVDIEYTPITAQPSVIEHTNTACINKPVATLLSNPRECNSFYQCSPTGVIVFECPAGTLFDSNRRYCERSDVASCQFLPQLPMPILPEYPGIIIPENEDQVLMRCRGQREGAKIRHPTNCRQYIHCSSLNRSQVFTCPAGTAFDELRMTCDWERNVKCNRSE
ncbi:peritrophin-48-like [Topomyia yanbarensis]|uniref:peritrophin-48-like n=1 Tax=Topomyia yanbarensis TaxID=2498891 RepID=UPI00273C9741|nr:peritrophin-48-like [Topomyia yanbarensis]